MVYSRVVLVLDGMGVIYRSADDVAELLVPFVLEQGGTTMRERIEREYIRASLGQITAAEFWKNVGVSSTFEDAYLAKHRVRSGLRAFLEDRPACVDSLWCLSNDVSEWSLKLRDRHGLSNHFNGFVISGDVGSRKPDLKIYENLLACIQRPAPDCVFVDDRLKNLNAAQRVGFRTVRFGTKQAEDGGHPTVQSFLELKRYLSEL
jgi:FMN phosphatase YigB (HAD superfamily)